MGILLSWTNLADAAGVNLTVDSEAQGLGGRGQQGPLAIKQGDHHQIKNGDQNR